MQARTSVIAVKAWRARVGGVGICAALMLGFTFVNWYGVYVFVDVSEVPFGPIATHDAWHPFSPIDVVLAASGALLLALAAVAWFAAARPIAPALGWLAISLGIACAALTLVRILDPPNVVGPHSHGIDTHLVQRLGFGGFFALASALGLALCGFAVRSASRRNAPSRPLGSS